MANETPTDARFDEATVKQLTSTDTIHARMLYKEPFTFRPTHTLWLRANDKPAVRDASLAFWRRIKLVPFAVRITPREQIKDLGEQLQLEASGILNWAIAGCLEWQNRGLAAPEIVLNATNEYRKEEDVIGEFVEARCRVRDRVWTPTSELYQAFMSWWAETRGMRVAVMSSKAFGRALERRGKLQPAKQHGARGWLGIELLTVTVRR
jgi:putative DNA primase/helicase